MKRVVITLGIVAILVSSCGRSDAPAGFQAKLRDQVASIRTLAEEGKPGLARGRLENLVASVTTRLDRGLIDEGWALQILESAQAVDIQLRSLPTRPQVEEPSPSPVQEGSADEGGDGKDKGKGKDEDSDHGKDD